LIDAEKANYPVSVMARLLGIDRRRYHEWVARRRAAPPEPSRMDRLVERVKHFHAASDATYGAPRIRADLLDEGWRVSLKTVAKAMRLAGVEGISPRTWHPPTTVPDPNAPKVPDLVKRRFDQGGKDLVWLSDITYLWAGSSWVYLCAVRDGHTRRVLGRLVADHMRADLVEDTLRQAVALRGKLPEKVIFHADKGCQYTSQQVAEAAVEFDLLRSMGRTGVCWDNAQAESFWSTFKNEYYHRHAFTGLDQIRRAAYVWIDSWYNAKRRHSALGYLSPLEYERRLFQ
jgi:transposase InsO family protein